jgi:hypothetical protein
MLIASAANTTVESRLPALRQFVDEHAFGAAHRHVDPTMGHDHESVEPTAESAA